MEHKCELTLGIAMKCFNHNKLDTDKEHLQADRNRANVFSILPSHISQRPDGVATELSTRLGITIKYHLWVRRVYFITNLMQQREAVILLVDLLSLTS